MRKNKFDELVFKQFGQDKNYDRLKCNILNIRETMLKKHLFFKKLSIYNQFSCCATIGIIATHTVLQYMDENRPLSKTTHKRFGYSIDRDWVDQKYFKIENNIK